MQQHANAVSSAVYHAQTAAQYLVCVDLLQLTTTSMSRSQRLCRLFLPAICSARVKKSVPYIVAKHHLAVLTSALMHHAQAGLATELVPQSAQVLESADLMLSCHAGSLRLAIGHAVSCCNQSCWACLLHQLHCLSGLIKSSVSA